MADKVRIGLIGCGNISPQYLEWCRIFEILDLVACADLDVTLAQERAEEFEVDRGCSVDELLGDADIEIVVNLTVPKVHASVNQQILGRRETCPHRKTLRRRQGGWEGCSGSGAAEGSAHGRCARHVSQRRHPDLSQADR